jgi:nucleoside-diphosphate-sugar epimerase
MKRVLVTGSSGFIGRYAVREFAKRGYEVIAPGSRELDLLNANQTRDYIERLKPTHLAHFAWYGEHAQIWNSQENLRWAAASKELFDAFVEAGGKNAFFAGSCAEYVWSFETLNEKMETAPASVYGTSKQHLGSYVKHVARKKSLSVAWGRIFFVYGPAEKETRFVPSILLPLLRNECAVIRFGNHVRDFLHVEDVARAAAHLLDSSYDGVVNIASGGPVTLAEFGKRLARIAGRELLLEIEYGEPTPENPLILKADVSRLRSTGFTPKYSLDEGLKTLVQGV